MMACQGSPIHQAAVLAYRIHQQEVQIALVSSLGTNRWVLPKGSVENGLSAHDSAEKEAYEEAGLYGVVSDTVIGTYDYRKVPLKGGRQCWVQVFPMKVLKAVANWPEKRLRRRTWMSVTDAAASVLEPQLRKLILNFGKQVAAHEKGGHNVSPDLELASGAALV